MTYRGICGIGTLAEFSAPGERDSLILGVFREAPGICRIEKSDLAGVQRYTVYKVARGYERYAKSACRRNAQHETRTSVDRLPRTTDKHIQK